jgi:hypothetical protein
LISITPDSVSKISEVTVASYTAALDGADNTHLQDLDGNWTKIDSGGGNLDIISNVLRAPSSDGYSPYRYNSQLDTVAQKVGATFSVGSSAHTAPYVAARVASDGTQAYMWGYHSDGWYEWIRNSGSITELAHSAGDAPTTPVDGYILCTDATKKGFVGGVEKVSSTNNDITAKGYPGIVKWYPDTGSSVYINNWYAEDISSATNLVIQDSTHAHSADNFALTQAHQLSVSDAIHSHIADNVALTQEGFLVIQDSIHTHSADGVTLTQAHILVISDAGHVHAADNVVLTQNHYLIINDALHAQISELVTLTFGTAVTPAERVFVIESQNRTYVIATQNRTYVIH